MSGKNHRLACSAEKRNKILKTRASTKLRRASQVCKVCECKIIWNKLNKTQREALTMLFVEGKWFYNHILSYRNEKHVLLKEINTTDIHSVKHLDKDNNEITTELKYLNSQQKQAILQRMFSNELTITELISRGFQKHGNLKFKTELNCIPLKQYGYTHKIKTKTKFRIAGIKGNVKVRGLDQIQEGSEFANANLVKKSDGYYVLLTTYINKDSVKNESNNKEIGLDFGIKTNITTSEGDKFDLSVRESERLKRLQQEMERRARRSKRRRKTVLKLRKEYQTLTNRKRDKANKLIHKLKQYKTIVIQDEQIKNWHKGLFGRNVQHSCMGILKQKLKMLPQTIVLDKFIPTTKFCPECGKMNKLSLSDRIYVCECGRNLDRDVHSAQNMLEIKNLVFEKFNFKLPTEHREVTLAEFKTSIGMELSVSASHGTQKREAAKPLGLR